MNIQRALDSANVRSLIAWDRPPCVSIYLPTERVGRATRQGPIRLRNLLTLAAERLVEAGWRGPEADALLADARGLIDDATFWGHQEHGMALFAAPGRSEVFRLPITVAEFVAVGETFHVKPLIRAVSEDRRFALLALSRNRVRLAAGTRTSIAEIPLPDDAPVSMEEALWFVDDEKQLQHHGADRTGRGEVTARFHGHGTPDEKGDERDRAFLRAVDGVVTRLIERDVPLVPAGVDELIARYRTVSAHPVLSEQAVSGNPDQLSLEDLHELAWPIVDQLVRDLRREDESRFGVAGLEGLASVLPAALVGRIAVVFVAGDVALWGRTADCGRSIELADDPAPGDRDLLDLVAAAVWTRGGRVHVVPGAEIPGPDVIAAVPRY